MTKQKRDWPRYRLAKRMRDHGISYRKIGLHLGVSATRATTMVREIERSRGRGHRAGEYAWWVGLPYALRLRLRELGFDSKESCTYFTAETLPMASAFRVSVPSGGSCEQDWRGQRTGLSVGDVNVIRKWLGVAPYVRPLVSDPVNDAIRLLEKRGYKITHSC